MKTGEIPVRAKLSGITFFHAVTFGKTGERVLTYRVHYRDGSSQDIPIVTGTNIGDWKTRNNSPELRKLVAYESDGKCFFRWTWKNPVPDLEISAISISGGNTQATPIVLGITVHDMPEKRNVVSIPLRNWIVRGNPTSGTNTSFKKIDNGFEMQNYRLELSAPDGKGVKLSPENYRTAVLKYSYNNVTDKWGFAHPCRRLMPALPERMAMENRLTAVSAAVITDGRFAGRAILTAIRQPGRRSGFR